MRRRASWIAVVITTSACSACEEPDPSPASAPRFTIAAEGVVHDGRTALLWTAHDAGRELEWPAAERRCRELVLGAGGPWRLPSIQELAALYDASQSQSCGDGICRVDPAIDLSSPYQWSAAARGEGRRVYFDFRHGSELAPLLRPALTRRALCTRAEPP
jgi:hypothetical protein